MIASRIAIVKVHAFICLVTAVLLILIVLPVHPVPAEASPGSRASSWTFSDNDDNLLRDTSDRVVKESIIVEDDASLLIINSTINIIQESDFQYFVVVKDRGTLILDNGLITSNNPINIYLNGSATLELRNDSSLSATSFTAQGTGVALTLDNSVISVDDLSLAELNELNLVSLSGAKRLKPQRLEKCRTLLRITDSEVEDLIVDSAGTVMFRNSTVLDDSWISDCDGIIEVDNSTINNLTVQSCGAFRAYTSYFQRIWIVQSTGTGTYTGLEFHNCTLKDVVVDVMPSILISGGVVSPSKKGFVDSLCSAETFRAMRGASFSFPLLFRGTTSAYLSNISAPEVEVRENSYVYLHNWQGKTEMIDGDYLTPDLRVLDHGLIELYRTLEVLVSDRNNAPLAGADVNVFEDIGNEPLYTGRTGMDGKVIRDVLSSIIMSDGEEFKGFYKAEATFTGSVNTVTAKMDSHLSVEIKLDVLLTDNVGSEDCSWLFWTIVLILIILISMCFLMIRTRRR
ncbi:MAG: hypothetical protein QGH39_09390 [Candidatus Thermoplasmatota archaeon]|jgi:hypothetical protein|nr:hypothetical protein [Candidatus Thermoplasmatota archaeon]MDP7265754.1 hypothetical protein [Candidatus Thermoplasmatota archaeon]